MADHLNVLPAQAHAPMQAQALIGFGEVRHTRLKPARHAFSYPTYFLMLPLRAMAAGGSAALARNRRGLLSFHDRDHGDGRPREHVWRKQHAAGGVAAGSASCDGVSLSTDARTSERSSPANARA